MTAGSYLKEQIGARMGIGANVKDEKPGLPQLILASIQINMRAGTLPPAEDNGISYLGVSSPMDKE